MGKYFLRDTPLAMLEREMMTPPHFVPRGGGRMALCRFRYRPEDVACRHCLQYLRRRCCEPVCPYLPERLEAGSVTLEELTRELCRSWDHTGLKRRAVQAARRAGQFLFDGQLHIARMLRMPGEELDPVSSRWLGAVYLLSASASLWQKTVSAVRPEQIDFAAVRLEQVGVREYTLYRAARGIYSGKLGVSSEELADPELVGDDTLLLILCGALTARFGPAVMRIGRAGK